MRIYKVTNEANLIGRLFKKGKQVDVRSRDLTTAIKGKWKLVGSTDDKRSKKIDKPECNINWENPTDCWKQLRFLKDHIWRKLKNHCVSRGLRLDRRSEGTRERIKNISAVMDFAFDCGWTGELDALDQKPLKKVLNKITSKEKKNDKAGTDDSDSVKRPKPRAKKQTVSGAGKDNRPKKDSGQAKEGEAIKEVPKKRGRAKKSTS
tara:strand:+ start:257 stop:874 length:618 start_codon:yes stop_codon:yes gene_type:complete